MRKCQICEYLLLGEGEVCKHCYALLPYQPGKQPTGPVGQSSVSTRPKRLIARVRQRRTRAS